MLEEKDKAEEKEKVALLEQAKKELEDWYKQHSEQVIFSLINHLIRISQVHPPLLSFAVEQAPSCK